MLKRALPLLMLVVLAAPAVAEIGNAHSNSHVDMDNLSASFDPGFDARDLSAGCDPAFDAKSLLPGFGPAFDFTGLKPAKYGPAFDFTGIGLALVPAGFAKSALPTR